VSLPCQQTDSSYETEGVNPGVAIATGCCSNQRTVTETAAPKARSSDGCAGKANRHHATLPLKVKRPKASELSTFIWVDLWLIVYLGYTFRSILQNKLKYCITKYNRSRDSAVGIATGYGLNDREVGVRVPVGSKFFTSPYCPDRLWGPPNLLHNGYRGFLPGGKAAGA
jgi:hypothetical protein